MEEERESEAVAGQPPEIDPLGAETDAFIAESGARLRAIDAAIAALEDGSYGTCEVCGEPIEEARLAARASERRCAEHNGEALPEPRLF